MLRMHFHLQYKAQYCLGLDNWCKQVGSAFHPKWGIGIMLDHISLIIILSVIINLVDWTGIDNIPFIDIVIFQLLIWFNLTGIIHIHTYH